MKKSIYKKISAIIALIFSLLTIVEGSQALLGITKPEFIVLTPLIIMSAQLIVLLIVSVIYFSNRTVALHSVEAMSIRSVVWLFCGLYGKLIKIIDSIQVKYKLS